MDELIERVVKAMVDCHDTGGDGMTYDDWIKDEKRDDDTGEWAREWMEARRLEAKAAIAALAKGDGA